MLYSPLAQAQPQLTSLLPEFISPMLTKEAHAPFDSAQHLFQIKWDGIRRVAFIEGGRVRLQSRVNS